MNYQKMRSARTEITVLAAFEGRTKVRDINRRTGVPPTTISSVLRNMIEARVVEKVGHCSYLLLDV